jgi:hypothetical protein
MSEEERDFDPGIPESENDISMIYANNTPEDYQEYLAGVDKHALLVLRTHISSADPESVTYLINNFPNARVQITADAKSRTEHEKNYPISVEWKEEKKREATDL